MSDTAIKLSRVERYIIRRHLEVDPDRVDGQEPVALLVGEAPGANTRIDCPLLPFPPGSAGGRLLALSRMPAELYLRRFARANLLDNASPGGWTSVERRSAGLRAAALRHRYAGKRVVLCGAQVARAFADVLAHASCTAAACGGAKPHVLEELEEIRLADGTSFVRVPHPSGRNRTMNTEQTRRASAEAVRRAALVDAPPCPRCSATIAEVEPTIHLHCICGAHLRRVHDAIVNAYPAWDVEEAA